LTIIDELAGWVAGLDLESIPERVLEVARHQVASVMGAIHAGAGSAGGRAVIETFSRLGEAGPSAAYPGGSRSSYHSALFQNAALSMALDYDDYLFMGHTGHSAVLAPLAIAELRGADTKAMLVAQVAANELAGRLGASVLFGPHNGQMWAHIHLLGAAAGASRVLGLDEERTANAMGIAMGEPVYALFPGFMGPQSKLLTAAVPSITGTTAALLAENGMTGSRAIIEDSEGFWAHFSFVPLPFMMTGLGRAWVTDTIAFKPYPGCAYIDTAVDALLEIMERFRDKRGRELEPAELGEVEVEASLLTVAMDAMSKAYLDRSRLSPTNINFSLSVSLAIVLLAGRLTGAELVDEYLGDNRIDILEMASRVSLAHDMTFSVEFLRCLDEVLDMKAVTAALDTREFMKARKKLRQHLGRVGALGPRDAVAGWQSLSARDRAFLTGLVSIKTFFAPPAGYDLGVRKLEQARMPFGARVTVRLKDGTVMTAERSIPRGGPGDPGRLEVAVEKFVRESSPYLGENGAREAAAVVLDLDGRSLEELRGALSRTPE
jgi:2-methylcitrate dehydratase PrpD